jgi:hypothetical protein
MLSLRLFGLFLLRYAARQLFWLLIQEPPRNTRKTSRVTPLAVASRYSMGFDVQRGKGERKAFYGGCARMLCRITLR